MRKLMTGVAAMALLCSTAAMAAGPDITCEAPRILLGGEAKDANPVVSVEVSYIVDQHAWRIFHHLANGGVVSRSEQYAITDMTNGKKAQWAGSLIRNRDIVMIGEVKFNSKNEPFYYEWIYNKSHNNAMELSSVAKCDWFIEVPRPTAETKEDKSAVVKTVPYRSDLKDSVPIYPAHEGRSALLDVLVGGQPIRMLLDTGATMMQISTDIADRIVRQRQGHWSTQIATVTMADGSKVKLKTIDVETVVIGSHTIRNIKMAVTDGGDMIMAFPVIDGIAPFKIDTRNKELVFETQEAAR